MSRSPESVRAAARVRVRVVSVKVKARRCAIAAVALGVTGAAVLALLIKQGMVSPGLWMAPIVALPLVCAALSFFFYRTEEAQQRRVFE